MVTKLKPQAGRCLGLAFASFLVFTLLMSGAALAQERYDAEQETSVKDEFLAEAQSAAAELGAEFGLSADDAVSLIYTLLFTAPNIEPGANMRWLMTDLSATYGLEPRELFGFLQLYGTELMAIGQGYGLVPERGTGPGYGPRSAEFARRASVGPHRQWQVEKVERQYGPRGAEEMRTERGPAYGLGPERSGMARADAMRNRFQKMHEEFHMRDAGYRYGKAHNGPNLDMWAAPKQHRLNPKVLAWKAEQEYARHYAARDKAVAKSWDGPGHKDDMYGKYSGPEAWKRIDKRTLVPGRAWRDTDTSDRMRLEGARFGEHPDGRMRGGQPDFMDEDGMDVSVEPLVGGFEPDMMGLEHNVAAMVPVVLDVVGSAIVESLAESTGVPEAEMEAMVVQALLEGLDAAMDEGLITQADAFDMLMLLTAADAMEQ
ncbi:MAG: hypothetical protein OXH72_00620 [Caldilineaceae bacterium]|nr:hypothetical protein [Caldilineaceae bacterium]